MTVPTAYGGSQATGQIGAVAAGLPHSHSTTFPQGRNSDPGPWKLRMSIKGCRNLLEAYADLMCPFLKSLDLHCPIEMECKSHM